MGTRTIFSPLHCGHAGEDPCSRDSKAKLENQVTTVDGPIQGERAKPDAGEETKISKWVRTKANEKPRVVCPLPGQGLCLTYLCVPTPRTELPCGWINCF